MKRSNISKKATPDLTGSSPEDASPADAAITAAEAAPERSKTPEAGGRITATVEPLTLAAGLYLFSVRGGAAPTQVGGLLLPAMQVGAGPGMPENGVEIMPGPGMSGSWLCNPGDRLVAKVTNAAAPVLLTSIRTADMTPLLIAVENLDARKDDSAGTRPTAQAIAPAVQPQLPEAPPALAPETPDIPLQIVAHVQNRGDVPFINASWAGFAGQRLAIEGFSLSPLRKIAASEVEYKALSATRSETPWVNGGALCGTRGKGLPLVGFCIRVKPQADGKRYDCEYSGTFASGKVVGPVRNGAPCWSTAPGDFLEALQVKIVERPQVDAPKAAG
jgi:hypothetical protein